MPLAYGERNPRRAHGVPHRCRRLRREPSRHGPRRGSRGTGALAARAQQRPAQGRLRGAPSTRTSSIPPTPRSSTTSSCGGWPTTSSTSCPTHRTPAGCATPSGATTPPPPVPWSPCRAPGAAPARHRRPEAAAVPRFRVARSPGTASSAWLRGRGTRGRTASSARCRWRPPPCFWRALLDAGVSPAGLGARDTLRLEAGLPLHGHELGPGITPLQAGLGWVVGWDKGDFRGRGPLERERVAGPRRHAAGASWPRDDSRRATAPPCWPGHGHRHGDERQLLPVLGRGIAMALVDAGATSLPVPSSPSTYAAGTSRPASRSSPSCAPALGAPALGEPARAHRERLHAAHRRRHRLDAGFPGPLVARRAFRRGARRLATGRAASTCRWDARARRLRPHAGPRRRQPALRARPGVLRRGRAPTTTRCPPSPAPWRRARSS